LWVKEFPAAITVCDTRGILLEMNLKSAANFSEEGGERLIGKKVFDCHPDPARTKFRKLLRKELTNVYTVEKRGKRKLIYQAPWYKAGRYRGLVELSLEIPRHIPNLNRDRPNRR
jgi:transcriptional regulator with PAS, ATPase and Fis domain